LPVNRRELLERMCMGFGAVGLAGLMGQQGAHAGVLDSGPRGAHYPARAKRIIFLFMNGGPSHVDTFDPKPALKQYEGKQPSGDLYRASKGSGFAPSPLKFHRCGKNGIEVSESLPNIGRIIDDCCVIRSMHTDVPNHEPALIQMHTGNVQPIRPSLGSWMLYGLGSANENLPGYVVLRPTNQIVVGPALWSNSFLPPETQATSVTTSDMLVDKLVTNIQNPSLTPSDQRDQLDLLGQLNRRHMLSRNNDRELDGQIKAMETAYRMQAQAMQTFDISKESSATREAYGDTAFGRSCLLARRLVEDGVRYVGVYYVNRGNQPWDTHTNHYDNHPKLCADSDRATAALITDLKQRGLLDDTLVIWSGEFGRTPYAEQTKDKPVGRDHHHTAFSLMLAGGGVKGGIAYGTSDEVGLRAAENPVHVHDLHATILHLLGMDHQKLTYRYSGRDFRLTDVFGNVVGGILA
jgi:hypothetical protein